MVKHRISNLSGCINFVQNNKNINNFLIGIDNIDQLKEILNVKLDKKIKFKNFNFSNEKLINPSKW